MMAVNRLLNIREPAALDELSARPGLPEFAADTLRRQAPDAHWVVLDGEGQVAGRCSLWWRATPAHPGHRLGLIGHYAADNMAVGRQLLDRACEELRANGCTLAVGPMDGNTWRSYRFVTESQGAPPFFLEPVNPSEWPRQFTETGFTPLARYHSSADEHLEDEGDEQARRATARMTKLGVTLRAFDPGRFDEELRSIHQMVTTSFRGGFLYQPIAEAEFAALYEPIRAHLRPDLVTIAMHEDRPVGFIFTLPDLFQARDGGRIETAIVKTLAVLPERRFAGLGSHLAAASRRTARAMGCRRLIHALMHESNSSRRIRAAYATPLRGYTLFAKPL